MKRLASLLVLPIFLLSILVTAQEPQPLHWPYDLPRSLKDYPEHEEHIRRHAEVQERLGRQRPAGVRKMSEDEGEKFRLEYWDFEQETQSRDAARMEDSSVAFATGGYANATSLIETSPLGGAILQHTNHERSFLDVFSRSIFARSFQCPAGTGSCASVGHPNLCCSIHASCVATSSGVGCCPSGQTCGDQVAGCDTSAGYTSCPGSSNGGCCVPGAKCEGSGCIFYGTRTVTTTLPTSTATHSYSSSTPAASISSIQANSIYTTTVTVTDAPSSFTTTRTVIISPSTCSSGFSSCAASLGGGCCRNGQTCGTDDSCTDPSAKTASTVTPSAPILPTSISAKSSVASTSGGITTTGTTTPSAGGCPTGYYMCSAYYNGDCCRIGRNCDSSSCPALPSTTVISAGVTVVVSGTGALSATTAADGATCASGWELCPQAVGGGCCPAGYLCGVSSCRATASGEGSTGKSQPSGASALRWAWGSLGVGVVSGGLMVLL